MPNFPEHITKLQPYVPGLAISSLASELGVEPSSIVKLASNENPLGTSKLALDAISNSAQEFSLYPDNDSLVLSETLARFHGVPRDWIVVGSGSEAVLSMAATALLTKEKNAVYAQYSFQAFAGATQRTGASHKVVASPDFHVDLKGLLSAIDSNTSIIYIANPGNPTGTFLYNSAIEAFLNEVPSNVVVLLDEAYVEYLPQEIRSPAIQWIQRYPNLLVTRTFSKAYGLAGLRVGYGIAQPGIADMLRRVRAPFSVTRLAQIAAAAAINDEEFLARTAECNRRGLDFLYDGFARLKLDYITSFANFVLVKTGDGNQISQQLTQRGIIVRPLKSYGLNEWIRISVGTQAENEKVITALSGEISSRS
ncbi:histidinol-phosphate transaminase [Herbaspirillum seropedicae]|uniref:histidinol-phosphate transaminase n=1 Tax=Herbaspirillum seropedicae TaxID=964 RepID=UPI002862DC47|nr:histidinol-phosphate transaminase [Herbaspirillum seropedicae]MDR6397480.1 histidinol-phosphate aminotransferase [Herbaspirillum seropedicae]